MNILNKDYEQFKIMGKDYFTIIIDKVEKRCFALINLSCRAAEEEYLSIKFEIERFEIDKRFSFVFSGNSIDENRIPKKYKSFSY